jgi:hypothetical protein
VSGRAYPRGYLNECQDAFLDGHVRAVEHFGGCPERIRYDNLKAAVERVLRGRDRIESDRSVALRSHYGFDSFFCRPGVAGSHEKGGVEGEVGRCRRRHLVPVPHVASMAELNEQLAGAARDDARFIAHRRITVGEHFALEAPVCERCRPSPSTWLLSAPTGSTPRAGCRCATASTRCRCGSRAGASMCASALSGSRVLDGATVVARHPRGLKGDEVLVLDHYLEVLAVKPGAFRGATALARARAGGCSGRTTSGSGPRSAAVFGDRDGTRVLIEVLLLHRSLPAEALVVGIGRALAAGSVDAAVVAIEARLASERAVAAVIPIGEGLHRFDRPPPSIAGYDDLLEAQ